MPSLPFTNSFYNDKFTALYNWLQSRGVSKEKAYRVAIGKIKKEYKI